ncbi:MAG: hypothetical protein JJU07_12715 [Natronohydrobacter sp.]|nr:hypothetical protein [Natronohydrobacter sp.]
MAYIANREPSLPPQTRDKSRESFRSISNVFEAFQRDLSPQEEMAIVAGNAGKIIHVRVVRYVEPDMLNIFGYDIEGNSAVLIQHIYQTSLMLVAVRPLEAQAYRVGFN